MTCNAVLRAEGKQAVPRTCRECGHGPCKVNPSEKAIAPQGHSPILMKVTGDLQSLPFRDMLTLAEVLKGNLPQQNMDAASVAEALLKTAETINSTKRNPVYGRDD